jgi:putative iron-regulated protein
MHIFHISKQANRISLIIASTLTFLGCWESTSEPVHTDIEATQVLTDIGTKVIFATYQDLELKAGILADAVAKLKVSKSELDLASAKQAWIDARRPWEQSEAFLFGPVASKGIDPSIDSWPVNKTDLDGVLSSDAALTKDYIDAQEGTLKGFHTMEYLLFGPTNNKSADKFSNREMEYLVAVTLSFKGAVALLSKSWDPASGNYLDTLTKAGKGSVVFGSQKSALQELVNGMIGICDEVATGKIADPFSQGNRALEESQFSDNSNFDFADNIRSVQNIYLGHIYTTTGNGLGVIISAINPALNIRLTSEIESAISSIGDMTPTFGEAISNNKNKVTEAQNAILKLKATLESDVLPLVSN